MYSYDKGLTTKIVDELFADLRPQLLSLLEKIVATPTIEIHFSIRILIKQRNGIQVLNF